MQRTKKLIDKRYFLLYNIYDAMSTLKKRQKVGNSDLNTIINENFSVTHAGLFQSEEEWIHPRRTIDDFEIVFVTDGEIFMEEGDRQIYAKRGSYSFFALISLTAVLAAVAGSAFIGFTLR